jgi:hypothetical protein
MPDISHVTRPPVIPVSGAARILTDALNQAHARGLTVSTDADLGVIATSTHRPGWEVDPRARAVSVLGCVLLAHQPPIVDVDHALAYVFGTRPEFAEGIEEGCAGKPAPDTADRLFCDGYVLGVQMRVLVWTVPCAVHLTRFRRGERCPQCADGVPVPRPAAETTRPLDTPRSLIAGLLAALTTAQVLEAVADDFRARRSGPVTPREAIDLDMAEQMLRELAVDFELPDGEEG